MNPLAPLAVTVPLGIAGVVAALDTLAPRWVYETLATLTSALVTGICAVLLVQSAQHPIVYWLGGWQPLPHGVAIGIAFDIDPFGAGMASLGATLTLAALVYSWRYFKAVGSLYHALMLVFLAATVGFCLTGDIFDLFVFFELAGVTAFILAAYKAEEAGPLQGAYNFAVSNTVAAFMILLGIALVYGRTGALNFAQIGNALQGHPVDGLVVISFVLLMCGYFVKGSIVPFHFWLADAHAVAPTPVCVLFSGVMVEMGLYGVWRIYWTMYGSTLALHAGPVREILIIAGAVTALVGAAMAFYQHHLKRLLAYTTVGHMGLFLMGVAVMRPDALAGAAIYVLGHAGLKSALFLCVGILSMRFASYDEMTLHGRGRRLLPLGVLYAIAGLGLAAVPPFGSYLGSELIQGAAGIPGYLWTVAVFFIAEAVIGAAVLRTAATVFLGWGSPEEGFYSSRAGAETEPETSETGRIPVSMWMPAAVLAAVGLVTGFLPGLRIAAERFAVQFQDRAYYSAVMFGSHAGPPAAQTSAAPGGTELAHGLGTAAAAIVLAILVLTRRSLPAAIRGPAGLLMPAINALRGAHSGVVNDYITWVVVGFAVFGLAFGLAVR